MHCTRRHPDRTTALRVGSIGGAALALAFAASCGDSARSSFESSDAEAGANIPPASSSDASSSSSSDASDASVPFVPPPPFQVTCTEKPCAVGLSADSLEGHAFCALLDDGRVACWGSDVGGVLGRPAPDGGPHGDIALPGFVHDVSGAVAIENTCVLLANGTVRCWGPGAGTLPFTGITKLSKGDSSRCAVVGPLSWSCMEDVDVAGSDGGPSQRSFDAPPGGSLREVFVGNASDEREPRVDVTFLLREDGALLSAGARNFIGRVTSLFPADPYFDQVLTNVTDIDVGDCVCAISSGDVYCWGSRATRAYPDDPLPLRIRFPEPAVRVSAVGFPGDVTPAEPAFRRVCVIGARGAVYCAGPNSSGQVGDGTRTPAYVPVKVDGLKEPAVDVVATRTTTCALVESGKVHCWGSGVTGALGNGFAKDELLPIQVNLP